MTWLSDSFSMYANCEVFYEGRASSTLETGNYLIIRKPDGSLLVHANNKTSPRNYQGPKSKLEVRGNVLISRSKSESLRIVLYRVHSYAPLVNWADAEIEITRTEKELVDELFDNWDYYFAGNFEIIYREYATPVGAIDLLGITDNLAHYVVEVKRRKGSVPDVAQLHRYAQALQDKRRVVRGFLAAPAIGDRALDYLARYDYSWVPVDFRN
jgi:RecB family endonuclease NucS